jgi:branched-subunit amino acid transport protein
MRLWVAIIAVAVVSLTIKAAGPAVLGERQLPTWTQDVIALLAPALLAALVVVDVAGPRWTHLNWPILGGLATVTGMRLLKAPMLLAVLVGVVATALLRLVTG